MKRCLIATIAFVLCTSSLHAQSNSDTCAELKAWEAVQPQSSDEAQKQYDTLRLYVERCAASDDQSYHTFLHLDEAVPLLDATDTARYDRYRDWLITVLYLNTTNPAYFCNCLYSIEQTYTSEGEYNRFPNASLAILHYLISQSECNDEGIQKEYNTSMNALRQQGKDTTLPPLDSIGLGFLDSTRSAVHNTLAPLSSTYLASFTSNPNPFKDETTLSFVLNRMTYTTVEVFDVLGRKVWGDDHGYSLDAGLHTVHIDASSLPSGSLYARISTGFGEVQTVKLVHE